MTIAEAHNRGLWWSSSLMLVVLWQYEVLVIQLCNKLFCSQWKVSTAEYSFVLESKKLMEKLLWFWKEKVLFRTTLRPRAEAMLWLPLAAGNGDKNVKAIVNKNINNKVPYQACLNWTAQGWLSHHPFEILISPTKSFSPFLLLSYGCSSESRCIHNCRMTQPWKDRPSQPTLRASESVRIYHEFHQFLQWLLKTDGIYYSYSDVWWYLSRYKILYYPGRCSKASASTDVHVNEKRERMIKITRCNYKIIIIRFAYYKKQNKQK